MSIEEATIEFDSKNNIIIVKTQIKEPSADDTLALFDRVLKMSELKNCNDVLFDATNTKKLPPTFELYSIAEHMTSQLYKLAKLRIAYVMPNILSNGFKFFSNVSANRGAEVHTFINVDEAKAFLLNK